METLTEPAVEEREEPAEQKRAASLGAVPDVEPPGGPAPPPDPVASAPSRPARASAATPASAPEVDPRRTPEPRVHPPRARRRRFRTLPWKSRLILSTFGFLLLFLGIAGLFLPFLQGILFLVLAAAVLSLASERVYRWLRGATSERWPGFWTRVERFRTRVLWKFRR